jgi:RNA-binding motif X-linked protein 2
LGVSLRKGPNKQPLARKKKKKQKKKKKKKKMNTVKHIERLNLEEARLGISGSASWHHQYKDSPYIFIGGLDSALNEGDLIAVFSQWGEPLHVHLVRDDETGESRGFAFLAYLDQRSTILAVDNMNGSKLMGRVVRVDHCDKYRPPKEMVEACEEQAEEEPAAAAGSVGPQDDEHKSRRRKKHRHRKSGDGENDDKDDSHRRRKRHRR